MHISTFVHARTSISTSSVQLDLLVRSYRSGFLNRDHVLTPPLVFFVNHNLQGMGLLPMPHPAC